MLKGKRLGKDLFLKKETGKGNMHQGKKQNYLRFSVIMILSVLLTTLSVVKLTGTMASAEEGMKDVEAAPSPAATETPAVTPKPTPKPTKTPKPTPTPTKTEVPKKGLVKVGKHYQYFKNGKPVKSQWKKIGGYKYYFKANGNAAVKSCKIDGTYYVFNAKGRLFKPKKNSLVSVEDMKFYVTPKGTPVPGWKIIKKKLYYVHKNGRCAADETISKIKFTESGYAKSDSVSNLKIKTMQVVSKITKPGMNKPQKLKACWYYMNTFRFKAKSYPDETKKNWKYQCALDMLNAKCGNCYGISHAFAALAKEVGYEPYVIVIPKVHCWVRIDGKYWDNMGNRMGAVKSNRPYNKNQISKFPAD